MTTTCNVKGAVYPGAMCGKVGVDMNGSASRCHAEPNSCLHQSDYAAPPSVTEVLSVALKAICLTRDYVGESTLPAIEGWEWYDAGCAIAALIPDDEWTVQFQLRVEKYKSQQAYWGSCPCGGGTEPCPDPATGKPLCGESTK
jgi:hypothetical protein